MTKMTAEQVAAELAKHGRWHRDFGGELARQAYDKSAELIREHLIETDEQRRERFEAWLWRFVFANMDEQQLADIDSAGKEKHDFAKAKFFERDGDGQYEQVDVEQSWISWQAALTWRGETKGGD
jgi:hypothetical protein